MHFISSFLEHCLERTDGPLSTGQRVTQVAHSARMRHAMFRSEDQTWQTPPEVWKAILSFEHRRKFDCDPCTTRRNIPARASYTEADDGLTKPWKGLAFCNPPYRHAAKWIEKASKSNAWVLVPARTDTRYWQRHVFGGERRFVVFLEGRPKFIRNGERGETPMAMALIYFGPDWERKAFCWQLHQPLPGTLVH